MLAPLNQACLYEAARFLLTNLAMDSTLSSMDISVDDISARRVVLKGKAYEYDYAGSCF